MRRFGPFFSICLVAASAALAGAQVVPSATARKISITAGGTVSIFQTGFAGDWNAQPPYYPVAHPSPQPLFGIGTYVDIKFSRWMQIEAEGRWQRFNQYQNIYQDNYLIGPRVPVYHFWRSSLYAKALGGFTNMNFYNASGGQGRFTTLAFGGGMDVKMTKRLSFRAVDVEYQYWPLWENSTLSPYGASVGLGYKIF